MGEQCNNLHKVTAWCQLSQSVLLPCYILIDWGILQAKYGISRPWHLQEEVLFLQLLL